MRISVLLYAAAPIAWSAAAPAALSAPTIEKTPNIPAFAPGVRILFQGDSITDGNRGRSADPNHILGHGYAFIVASKYGALWPEKNLVFMNRGVSGNTVENLTARWQKDTIDLKPDVLSITIGINDYGRGVSVDDFEKQYDALLDQTLKALPKVKLILGEPFGLPVTRYKANWEQIRAELAKRQAVVAKLGAKYNAPVVPFQKAFDDACQRAPADYWIWDGIHPTYSGHQIMADAWENTIRQLKAAP